MPLATQMRLSLWVGVLGVPAGRLHQRLGHIFAIHLIHMVLLPGHRHSTNHEPCRIRARLRGCLALPSSFSLLPKFGMPCCIGSCICGTQPCNCTGCIGACSATVCIMPGMKGAAVASVARWAQSPEKGLHLHWGRARHWHAISHPLRGLGGSRGSLRSL